MFGHFPEDLLENFKEAYAERFIRLPSGLYEINRGKEKTTLTPAKGDPKTGGELPPGTKNRDVSGTRMTDSGAAGRVKGAQAAVNKAKTPGAKKAAMKNLHSAQTG